MTGTNLGTATMLRACLLCAALFLGPAARAQDATARETDRMLNLLVETLEQHGLRMDSNVVQRAAVEAVLRTADPHGSLIGASALEQMERVRAGQLYTSGLQLTMTNGAPLVVAVDTGGPADSAGIAPGDVIVAVNDADLTSTDLVTAQGALRGTEPQTLRVNVRKPTTETNRVAVTLTLRELPGIEVAEVFPTGLCYLRINGLYPGTAERILYHIDDWRENGYFGLILDLRTSNGADLDGAAAVASLFAEENTMLFAFRDPSDQDVKVHKAAGTTPVGMPTMVLIDGQTRGASEVLAASLKRSARGAMLLGSASSGNPSIRDAVAFGPDLYLYMATKRLVTADGTRYDGTHGVEPDVVVVPRAVAAYVADEPGQPVRKREQLEEEIEDRLLGERVKGDTALGRAVDILLGLKALDIRGIQRTSSS